MFGTASLVSGNNVLVAVIPADGFPEMVEIPAAGVGLVAQHHAGPLVVAHSAGPAVGEQVNVDIRRAQQESVVTGFGDALFAVRPGGHLNRLDDLDLPGLRPGTAGWSGVGHDPYPSCLCCER